MTKLSATIEQWAEYLKHHKPGSKLEVPFAKQQNLIAYLFRKDPNRVKVVHLCCGRGYGKSVLLIFLSTMMLSLGPEQVGIFLEPDWKRVRRVFLKKWRQLVPAHLYSHNKTEQCITWLPTGALLFYGPRNITGSQEAAEDSQLGQDATFVVDDEAALRCSEMLFRNTLAVIREPSDIRFYLTASTPRVGEYQMLVETPQHELFRGSSRDNPYLPEGYVEQLIENMSPDQVERDIEGKFISLKGRIWKTFVDEPWPMGNIDDEHRKFIPGLPWWLFCDLGSATASYMVVQQRDARYRGQRIFDHDETVWTAVADLCPYQDASASRAFQRLKDEFGSPAGVVAGKDIGTRASTDGATIAHFASNTFGASTRIYPCDESIYSKSVQYDAANYLICSATGERRFTVARNFVSLEPQSRRGLREMFKQDAWPSEDKRRMTDFLPKDKSNIVQHTRDGFLMGSVQIMHRPQWTYQHTSVG